MIQPARPLLVLGVGNVLLRDDGVGVHAIRELRARVEWGSVALPPDTTIVDGGTLGIGLLPLVSRARALLIVDAVDWGREPGAVEVMGADALLAPDPSIAVGTSTDRVGVGGLLALGRLLDTLPEAIALVGVQPAEIAVGLDLTELVRAALPAAIDAVVEAAWRLDSLSAVSDAALLARALESVGTLA